MKKIGIIIGKFFPLHIGHVNFIQRASGIVDRLYVVISYSDDADDLLTSNSRFVKEITPKDRLRFVKQTFKNRPFCWMKITIPSKATTGRNGQQL